MVILISTTSQNRPLVRAGIVSNLLGNSSIKTTQIYAKAIEQKVSDDMRDLRLKMQISKKEYNTLFSKTI